MPRSTSDGRSARSAGEAPPLLSGIGGLGLATIAGALLGIGLLGVWDYQERGVRVVAVGTEQGVSVLVTSGHRRVLVQAGATGDALDEGLDGYLAPLHRDIDVTLVDGVTAGATDEAPATSPRLRIRSGGDRGLKALAASSTIDLPNGVTMAVLLEPGSSDPDRGWIVMIARGRASVAIAGGEGDWVADTIAQRRPGVVVAAGGPDWKDTSMLDAPLVVTSSRAPASSEPTRTRGAVHRLFPSQSVEFRLHQAGVEVPDPVREPLRQEAANPRAASRAIDRSEGRNGRSR